MSNIASRDKNRICLLNEKFTKNNNIVCRTIEDDIHVIFNPNFLDRSVSFVLNEIGFFIWNSFDGKITGENITDKIKTIFNMEQPIVAEDINNFILDLKSSFLINNNTDNNVPNNIFYLKNINYLAPILRMIDMEPLLSINDDSGNSRNCGICGGGCYSIKTAYSYY